MKDKEAREQIERLDRRIAKLERDNIFYLGPLYFFDALIDRPKINLKNIIILILKHLDLKIEHHKVEDHFSLVAKNENTEDVTQEDATQA